MRNYIWTAVVLLLLVLLDVRPASSKSDIQQTSTESNTYEKKINSTDRYDKTDATFDTSEDQTEIPETIDEILHKFESLEEIHTNETMDPSEVLSTEDYVDNMGGEESLVTEAATDTMENSTTEIDSTVQLETIVIKNIRINNTSGSKGINKPVSVVIEDSIDELDLVDSTTPIDEEFVDVGNVYNDAIMIASTEISAEGKTISFVKSDSFGGNYSDKYEYLVYDNSTVPCILAALSVTLKVNYYTIDFEKTTKAIRVPRGVMVSGQCGKDESYMTLSWPTKAGNWNNITFVMKNNGEKFYVDRVRISISLDSTVVPNALDTTLTENSGANLGLFSAPLENGAYLCKSKSKLSCGEIDVEIDHLSLIAFNDMQTDFSREEIDCDSVKFGHSMTFVISALVIIILVSVVTSLLYKRRANVYKSELP